MCQFFFFFFKKCDYPDSAVTTGKHRPQEIARDDKRHRTKNDPRTKQIFSLTPLISFKLDKNLANFLTERKRKKIVDKGN